MKKIWVTLDSKVNQVEFYIPENASITLIRKMLDEKYGSDEWLGWSDIQNPQ